MQNKILNNMFLIIQKFIRRILERYNFVIIKIIILLILTVFASVHSQKFIYFIFSIIELFIIYNILDYIAVINKKLSYTLSIIVDFLFILQQIILYYTGDFITTVILYNIDSFNAVGNTFYIYVIVFIIALIISFIPSISSLIIKYSRKRRLYLSILLLILSLIVYKINSKIYSPLMSLSWTGLEIIKNKTFLYQLTNFDYLESHSKFIKERIDGTNNYIQLKENKRPNIIVIFTEGLSAEVLDVYNNLNLNLTPNINKLYERSLVFNNYYNHTAPTYRGLRGQMISGYQYLNGYIKTRGFGEEDKTNHLNTNMVSLIDILNYYQYNTYFINSEPSNVQFSNYLGTFNFNDVISGEIKDRYLSDKEVFTLLWDTIQKVNEPFFCGIYNIGTHHGQNSPDVMYADGNNYILNKFHNFDAQFGIFYNLFMGSDISDNTILIFTTDHATFPSPEYKKTFKSAQKYFVNNVPLFFYWRGIEQKIIDVHGRNSLDLTPTILDLLNIEMHNNYFLGSSLFLENTSDFSTITAIGDIFYYTKNNEIQKIVSGGGGRVVQLIKDYYRISINYK